MEQSFDYCNAMRHGTEEERAEQLRRYVAEMNLEKLITDEKVQLWRKCAEEASSQYSRKGYTPEEQEKIRMNLFWNTYHSHYKPMLDSLKADCQMAFKRYDVAKNSGAMNAEHLDAEVHKLRRCYAQIESLTDEITRANNSKKFLAVFSLLISAINPVPAILLMVMGGLVLGFQKNVAFRSRLILYNNARSIRRNVMSLKEKQEALRHSKNDALRKYISVKDQRNDLKNELRNLDKTLMETGINLEINPARERARDAKLSNPLRGNLLLEDMLRTIFNASYDSDSLDRELYYNALACLPVIHPNGGIADLEFIRGEERILVSELKDHRIATFFVDRWCGLRGLTPAYKKQTEQPRNQQQAQKPVQQQINKQNNGPKHRR